MKVWGCQERFGPFGIASPFSDHRSAKPCKLFCCSTIKMLQVQSVCQADL